MAAAAGALILAAGSAMAKPELPPCPDLSGSFGSSMTAAARPLGALCDSWRTLDDRLQSLGISVGVNWVMEGFKNFRGGITTAGAQPASTLDVYLSLDTQPLFHLPGGKFYVDLEDHAGDDPSTDLVGDLQVFDKLNYSPYLQIFEIWYQQRLFGDWLRIKVGKIDANTEFSVITNGLGFINSSTQVTPTLFVFPTTPDPMPGINVFFTPGKLFYASFGAFYSNSGERFLDFTGAPYAIQPTRNGTFLIGETGLTWSHLPELRTDGDARLGFWGHTGSFKKFDGKAANSAGGMYAIFDQTLWRRAGNDNARALRGFLEYGRTGQSLSSIYEHFGGGITWTGFPGRPHDTIGFSPQYARLSPDAGFPHDYELALETFYNLRLNRQLSLQPDLQYIIDPGGTYPDALVGTVRLKVNL